MSSSVRSTETGSPLDEGAEGGHIGWQASEVGEAIGAMGAIGVDLAEGAEVAIEVDAAMAAVAAIEVDAADIEDADKVDEEENEDDD